MPAPLHRRAILPRRSRPHPWAAEKSLPPRGKHRLPASRHFRAGESDPLRPTGHSERKRDRTDCRTARIATWCSLGNRRSRDRLQPAAGRGRPASATRNARRRRSGPRPRDPGDRSPWRCSSPAQTVRRIRSAHEFASAALRARIAWRPLLQACDRLTPFPGSCYVCFGSVTAGSRSQPSFCNTRCSIATACALASSSGRA